MKEEVVDNWNDLVANLINFIEIEEALTVDPRTQIRIRNLFEELGVWEKND